MQPDPTDDAKPIWTSRTIWASIITLAAGLLTATGLVDLQLTEAEVQDWAGWIVTGLGALFGLLRLITKSPVTARRPSDETIASLALLLVLGLGVSLTACGVATTAETPQQRAYALIGTYAVLAQEAATLIENPDTPDEVVEAISLADQLAWPVITALSDAVRRYIALSDELAALEASGHMPPDALAGATSRTFDELSAGILQATPALQQFAAALNQLREIRS